MPNRKIRLGDEIEDVTSHTIGIAIGYIEYLHGGTSWLIQCSTTDNNEKLLSQEVASAYCRRVGEGVYLQPKPPMGFQAGQG